MNSKILYDLSVSLKNRMSHTRNLDVAAPKIETWLNLRSEVLELGNIGKVKGMNTSLLEWYKYSLILGKNGQITVKYFLKCF